MDQLIPCLGKINKSNSVIVWIIKSHALVISTNQMLYGMGHQITCFGKMQPSYSNLHSYVPFVCLSASPKARKTSFTLSGVALYPIIPILQIFPACFPRPPEI